MHFIINENIKIVRISYAKHHRSFSLTACTHCVCSGEKNEIVWLPQGCGLSFSMAISFRSCLTLTSTDIAGFGGLWLFFIAYQNTIHPPRFVSMEATLATGPYPLIKAQACPGPFARRDACKQVVATAWILEVCRKNRSKEETAGDRTQRIGREGKEEVCELALYGYAEGKIKVWKGRPRGHRM